ncbi:hypothetical protein [Paraburkholderia tropica]|uniref:hypothetical protein n=1 Tax=Paraburkholderia tropica TaxID=92647 RepID=UPI002AB61A82|nr:hypothetical protein [Paraburkholderia tropica]
MRNKNIKSSISSDRFEVAKIKEFPFAMENSKWIITQEIREKFNIYVWMSIDFELEFADGSVLTNDKYSNMLVVIKEFLRFKWENSSANLQQYWKKLSYFISFLVNVRGVSCLSDAWGIDEYVVHRKNMGNLKLKDTNSRTGKKSQLAAGVLHKYILPVKELWHFSSQMRYGLTVEPWVGRTAAKVAGVKAEQENRVKPYDLYVFAGFVRVARKDLETVDEVCKLILSNTRYIQKMAAANRLRTAAAIAIAATEGMRPDEIYALDLNCLKKGKLHINGEMVDVTWICGRIFKDESPGGRPHKWLASDETILAVETMKKIRIAFDKAIGKGLISLKDAKVLEGSRDYLFPKFRISGGSKSCKSVNGLNALKIYIQRPEVREFLSENEVVTHRRFRPTIARAFARLKLGDVTYFRHHFGHAWWSTTRGYFLTFSDDEFQSEVSDYINSEAQNLLHNVLSSPHPLQGGRGRQIEQYRREYPVMTFESQKALVRSLQRGHQIRIGPQSLCMAKNGGALCSQDCLYEEETCLGCPNGVVTSIHLPVWEDMRERNRALLHDLPVGSPGEIAISENLRDIEAAIRNMGGL